MWASMRHSLLSSTMAAAPSTQISSGGIAGRPTPPGLLPTPSAANFSPIYPSPTGMLLAIETWHACMPTAKFRGFCPYPTCQRCQRISPHQHAQAPCVSGAKGVVQKHRQQSSSCPTLLGGLRNILHSPSKHIHTTSAPLFNCASFGVGLAGVSSPPPPPEHVWGPYRSTAIFCSTVIILAVPRYPTNTIISGPTATIISGPTVLSRVRS